MDIYFQKEYGIINELIENGKSEVFKFQSSNGIVQNMFIKREIPTTGGDIYYDIVSPYGYGGPIVFECKEGSRTELISEYTLAFQEYCKKNKIVSEFVRFHPIVENYKDFESLYYITHDRMTVGTNLKDYDDPVEAEFTKSCRKRIRRALRDGISYRVIERPNTIHSFKEIYYSTMDRNEARGYYYFDEEYFQKCLEYFRDNIILVEALFEDKVIAAGFYFVWDKVIHIHLSGTLSEYLYLSPAYILRYAVTLWGKEHGCELIHHGGGRSNSVEDGLYLFKKQFGEKTAFDFCVGKKIWNKEVYDELCKEKNKTVDIEGYFPKYREV